MRIWYIQQVGQKGVFYKPVFTVEEAAVALETLYELMLFLLEENMIPDFTNQGGLEVGVKSADTGIIKWVEWESENGRDINTFIEDQCN